MAPKRVNGKKRKSGELEDNADPGSAVAEDEAKDSAASVALTDTQWRGMTPEHQGQTWIYVYIYIYVYMYI